MAFKDNLVAIRELRKKKPADVIKETGIAKQQYYAWESGEYKPSEDNLTILSRYFKIPMSLFYKEQVTQKDIMEADNKESDADWFKRTIETLIHQNGETIHEFRLRSKDEIDNLRLDKTKLFDLLYVRLKPSQESQQ